MNWNIQELRLAAVLPIILAKEMVSSCKRMCVWDEGSILSELLFTKANNHKIVWGVPKMVHLYWVR